MAAQGYLPRWTIDLGSGSETFTEQRLLGLAGEFPRMDDRYEMLPHRWGCSRCPTCPSSAGPAVGSAGSAPST
ncbi:hypothetical protein ACU61A_37090 [Pseudonocardia sichuanensis]